jgi:hypothetical protein
MQLRVAWSLTLANIPMSEIRLICHPATPALKTDRVDVEIRKAGEGRLFVRYVLECDTGMLMLPEPFAPVRSDRLWQTTCFEMFIKQTDNERYFEYNFSPSTEWALYRFSDYRRGMAEEMIRRPRITCDYSESHFALNAEFELPDDLLKESFMLGLAAVVEENDGNKSYWALAHPLNEPDFHHKDCFTMLMAAPRVS